MKGTSTNPRADFGHRQEYGLAKHFMAFLVLGINTSPSIRKSLEPIKIKENMLFHPRVRRSGEYRQEIVYFKLNIENLH